MSQADWRSAGASLAPLGDVTLLLLIGDSPVSLAAVARGAATAAAGRRVAVFDLAGAFGTEDGDGILPALREGRSLNALARPLDDGSGERFIVPRGTGSMDAAIASNDRWPKLVEGFRASHAMMILLVPTGCDEIGLYVALADRAFRLTLQDSVPRLEPWVTSAPEAAGRTAEQAAMEQSASMPSFVLPPAPPSGADASVPTTARVSPIPPMMAVSPTRSKRRGLRRLRRPIALGVAILVVGLAASAWTKWQASRRPKETPTVRSQSDSLAAIDASSPTAQDTVTLPVVANPADSALAAKWGVELVATNDRTDANFRLARTNTLPAGTLSPMVLGGDSSPWYKIVAGAFIDRTAAELMRANLRQTGVLARDAGVVSRVPFALRLDTALTPEAAKARAAEYAARGVGAYALLRDDGMATVYAGAFATPEQSVLLFIELQKTGLSPELSFRVGRTY